MTNSSVTTVNPRLRRGHATTRPWFFLALPTYSTHRCGDGGMMSDRKCPSAYIAVRRLIASLVGSFTLLLLVALAAWIVISPGAGHPPWQ